MGRIDRHPAAFPPMPAVARILSRFDRKQLHGFIAVAIDLADAMDGDPDLENATGEGDAFEEHNARFGDDGPGDPVSDPGGCEHDGREPDHDAEIETWAHWLDHPPELHVGKRPGHTN